MCGRDWSSDVCSSDLEYLDYDSLHTLSKGRQIVVSAESMSGNCTVWTDINGRVRFEIIGYSVLVLTACLILLLTFTMCRLYQTKRR